MIIVDKSVCDECGTCVGVCPKNAIVLAESLSIDNEKCILCCRCVDICPFEAITESGNRRAP